MKTFLALIFAVPTFCYATLGKDRSSVEDDISALSAKAMVGASSLPTHSEIKIDMLDFHGQIFTEYSSASGKVFAVTWHGEAQPFLLPFLGDYYAEFRKLDAATPKGRRYLRHPLITSEVTVIRGGHLGDIRGIAYLNEEIPPGVKIGDLK